MNRCFSCTGANRNRASKLWVVLLCLASMIGCQGFSSKSSSVQQTPSGTLSLIGASLDFGSVTTGTSKTLTMTASNTGTVSVTISSASISNQYFSLTAPSLPVTILSGQSTNISLVFAPKTAGTFNATVAIGSDASDSSVTVSLSGTGVASVQLAVNPGNETFGNVTVGT